MIRTVGRLQIFRGQDFQATLKFRLNEGYDALDFTDLEEFKIGFKKEDGTLLTLTSEGEGAQVAVTGVGEMGNILFNMTDEQTESLKKGDGQNLHIYYDIDGDEKTMVLEKVLDVVDTETL